MATNCLMCGASLEEEEAEAEAGKEEPREKKLPRWARPLIVVGLTLVFLAAGFYGLYVLMNAQPADTEPTPTLTQTPTVTPTPRPTRTPAPTSTPTPMPPLTYQVQPGDTLSAIAETFGTSVTDILALNPGLEPEALPVGYVLLIPAGTLTPTTTPTLDPNLPTPTPGNFIVYVVERGDTLSSIAEEYGVSIVLIREANADQLPVGSDDIFVGQSLIIPLGTPVPSPVPTIDPLATQTPIPAYAAPALLSPPDGATLAGTELPIVLQWAAVSVLEEAEWYEVTLLFPDGAREHTFYTRATIWRVPFDILLEAEGQAPEFQWQVMVVREVEGRGGQLAYRKAGNVSAVRTFVWIKPTPTPTPTSTPTP
jgi:LysM repeat protein